MKVERFRAGDRVRCGELEGVVIKRTDQQLEVRILNPHANGRTRAWTTGWTPQLNTGSGGHPCVCSDCGRPFQGNQYDCWCATCDRAH